MHEEDTENRIAELERQLGEPPRRIPAAFRLSELLGFRWWYFLLLFVVALAPLILWMNSPTAFAVVVGLALLGIFGYQLRSATKRFALLRWGRVAQVTGTQILSQGTYYSGTTWHNFPLPIAHRWTVKRPLYSGPSTKTLIRYTLSGVAGELTVSGREYIDGVVLADSRRPARALCVTSFPYDLDRDESGNWIGRIRPRLMAGMAIWSIVVIGFLGLAAVSAIRPDRFVGWLCAHDAAPNAVDCSKYTSSDSTETSPVINVPHGGNLEVRNSYTEKRKTITCNDGNLTLSGSGVFTVGGHCASLTISAWDSQIHVESADAINISNRSNQVELAGHSESLTVSAYNNEVHVDSADTINVSGYNNTVTYRSGAPLITDSGRNNTIQRG